MTEAAIIGIISAGAAILGGLVTAIATRGVEKLRLRIALREKAEERRLAAAQAFLETASAWVEWLTFMARVGSQAHSDEDVVQENNARSKRRQAAYRELLLLSSEDLGKWLREVYVPAEYEFNRHFTDAVIKGVTPSDEAHAFRRRLQQLLSGELVDRLRDEISALREPHRQVR
jgi:uncharacterized FlaG/YvyC family protein